MLSAGGTNDPECAELGLRPHRGTAYAHAGGISCQCHAGITLTAVRSQVLAQMLHLDCAFSCLFSRVTPLGFLLTFGG
jgi:hypothetical protein